MATNHLRGAGAAGLAAPQRAGVHPGGLAPPHQPGGMATGLTAPQKDETTGWQADGFRGQGKADSSDSHGALVLGQPAAAGPTMTSREIAELTGKEHKHVLRDIRSMLEQLSMAEAGYAQNWTDPQNGKTYTMLALPKGLTITLMAGYSVPMRHRIVTRWEALEAQAAAPAFAVPQTLPEALRLAADLADQKAQATAALAIAAPKALALDRIATESKGSVSVRVAAQIVNMQERQFVALLIEHGWLYRHGGRGGLLGRAGKVRAGLVEMKRKEVQRPDGPTVVVARAFITSHGIAKLAELIEREAQHLRETEALPDCQQTQLLLPIEDARREG